MDAWKEATVAVILLLLVGGCESSAARYRREREEQHRRDEEAAEERRREQQNERDRAVAEDVRKSGEEKEAAEERRREQQNERDRAVAEYVRKSREEKEADERQRKEKEAEDEKARAQIAAVNSAWAAQDRELRAQGIVPISAGDLIDRYGADEVAGDLKFKNKVLQIDGYVDLVGKDLTETAYVTLRGVSDRGLRRVQVFFDATRAGELTRVSPGQFLIVRGTCSGLTINVLIQSGRIMNR
jgi:hypothetical protein